MSRRIGNRELKGLLRLRNKHPPSPHVIFVTKDAKSIVQHKSKQYGRKEPADDEEDEGEGYSGDEDDNEGEGGYEGDIKDDMMDDRQDENETQEQFDDESNNNEEGEVEDVTSETKKLKTSASTDKPMTNRGRPAKHARGRGRPPKNARSMQQDKPAQQQAEKKQPQAGDIDYDSMNDSLDSDPRAFQKEVDDAKTAKKVKSKQGLPDNVRAAKRDMEPESDDVEGEEGQDEQGFEDVEYDYEQDFVGGESEPTRTHAIIYSDGEFERRPTARTGNKEKNDGIIPYKADHENDINNSDEESITEGISQIMQQKPASKAMKSTTGVRGGKSAGTKAGRIQSEELPVTTVGRKKAKGNMIEEEKSDAIQSKGVRGTSKTMKGKRDQLDDDDLLEDHEDAEEIAEEEKVLPALKKRGRPPKGYANK